MIQLQQFRVVIEPDYIDNLKTEFRRSHCVLVPRILEPSLLDFLIARFQGATWRRKAHSNIRVETISMDRLGLEVLHFLINAPNFLNFIAEISETKMITWCGGRVYRMLPNSGHYDSWHDDDIEHRLVGISINLSPLPYCGGVFQMREQGSKRLLTQIANTGLGDALFFRISGNLEHQVTEVTGNQPKTAFAGWFQLGELDLASRLKNGDRRHPSITAD
jgi:hypothetical protein